ncbi:Wzz/FepE/Etk N-terminal domain-containing protein [Zobellella sp. DQSA1]|uniref:Wzz/FepE/Etk N-terminal domain-containing protein n=1 Tax=Zobellella sp. DQSA1 TaxID=3342386 RepID=UPI0035C212C7
MSKEQDQENARVFPALPAYPYYQDESISFVDLAKILVKRWKVMVSVFFLVILLSLIAVMMMPKKYEYTTVYSLAEVDIQTPLESPSALLTKVNSIYLIPQVRTLRQQHNLESLPFDIKVIAPKDTGIILLISEAKEADEGLVNQLHQGLVDALEKEQRILFMRRKSSFENQLLSVKALQERAMESSAVNASELIISYASQIATLEMQMNNMKEGEAAEQAVQSLETKGIGKRVIMMAIAAFAIVFSVLVVFLIEFFSKVRLSIAEQE